MNDRTNDQVDLTIQEINNDPAKNANNCVENSSDEENYSYSDDSLCSDASFNESDITNVTTRSSVISRNSYSYSSASKSSNNSEESDMEKNLKGTRKKNYLSSSLSVSSSGTSVNTRKNMSFTNNEMMKIERENQYLLRKIMAKSTPSKSVQIQTVPNRPSSSAINRKRLQRKIEEENMMMLRRIQNAKPHISAVKRAPKHQLKSVL
ncbi:cilia- and flagella-associated protein 97-like [Chelonus insularis]|uniref:cilia- and flagella-associated protein 97-like n=1 Tax=Chelonus insularis TaxID=460826 RepID=UPI00158CB8F1|nr:cilia- and flagella-associated protein 97-like [Chelonus insularis]